MDLEASQKVIVLFNLIILVTVFSRKLKDLAQM